MPEKNQKLWDDWRKAVQDGPEKSAFTRPKYKLYAYATRGRTYVDTVSLGDMKTFLVRCVYPIDPDFVASPMIKVLIDMAWALPRRYEKNFSGRVTSVKVERIYHNAL